MADPLRVLHCPDMVGGHPQQLARAERALGLDSWSVAWQASRFDYSCDEVLSSGRSGALGKGWMRLKLLARALVRFDVIHFNYGLTLMPELGGGRRGMWKRLLGGAELSDLPLLKAAGKTIVVTFQGDDARQGDRLQAFAEFDWRQEFGNDYYSEAGDAHKRWRIATMARWADRIYALNPDLLRVLPASAQFFPYAHVDLEQYKPGNPPANQVPLVMHAPSHRGVKGTRHILETVDRLRREEIAFDFELVEGKTRAEAMERYQHADLMVDQLLLGWYGGLAVECMALGVPVISYIRPADLERVPAGMRAALPVILADRSTLYAVLKDWLTVRRGELPEVRRRCRQYVETWHNPLQIARMVADEYRRLRQPVHLPRAA
jgi:glycosyltransferase involved in cell wall biosynthesis